MLNWIRKKPPEPPVETVAATPCTALVDDLVGELPEGARGEVRQRVESFRRLPPQEQERQLPATYLFLEQALTDGDGLRPGKAELRGRVVTRHESLLAVPGFRLIFEPQELQQLFLCRELVSTLLERSREDVDPDDRLADTLAWLAEVPDRAADPVPFGIEASQPRSTEEWIDLLTRITRTLYERVERGRGLQAARRRFSRAYDDLARRYLGLPAFSVVVGLLPEALLDEDKIRGLDRGQMEQVVLDKVEHLQQINRRLQEKNLQLEQAQQALEKANVDLEERVQERTELLRMANDNLRESEEKLRLITAAAHDAIVMLDDLGRVSFWNAAAERMFGYPRSEMLGQDVCRHLVPRRFQAQFQHGLRRFAETGEAVAVGETIEWRALGKERQEFPVELSLSAVRIQGRWHALAVVRDITERKRAEEERRQLEERMQQNQRLESLGMLAGGIAHDFNNLLSTILGNAGLARRRAASAALGKADAVADNLSGIEAAAARAADLTQQMLAYSGRGHFVIEPFDLSELVEEMTQLLKISISNRAELRCELAAGLPAIEADRAQIQQVVMNLITNASEALGEDGGAIVARTGVLDAGEGELARLELGSELAAGRYAFFEVADTGSGMDEETRAKIFDPFFSTKFVGRGLGLAAVLGIVRGHRGAIEVDSRPGEGTRFRALFPATEAAIERPLPAPAADAGSFREARVAGTVLVVDDEPAVRGMASQALEILGFQVLAAEDGQQALDLFRQRAAEIDLVLMDITMPKMDGKEAFLKMRELSPDARVILSSGYSQQEALREMKGDRPLGFLQKPYDLATLASEVTAALQG